MAAGRLIGLDAARGVALLGMMAVHALWAFDAQDEVTWHFSLAAGRSAAAFAVLAGVGIALMTRRRQVPKEERRGVTAMLATRALVIGTIGLALGHTDASLATVILVFYAGLFVLAIPLSFLSTRVLAVLAPTIAIVVPVVSHLLRPSLPEAAGGHPSFHELFYHPVTLVNDVFITGFYPVLAWTAYICAGLVIGRLQLSSRRVATRLLVGGLAVAVGASALSWLLLGPLGGDQRLNAAASASGRSATDVSQTLTWGAGGVTPTETWWWLATTAPHSTTPLDLLHTGGTSVALIGGMLLLARSWPLLLAPLAAAGSMTLTLYTAHILFMNSPLDVFPATPGYVIQVVFALSFAVIWHATFGRGPLESLTTAASKAARRRADRGMRRQAASAS